MNTEDHRISPTAWTGVILLAIGVLLLLDQMSLLHARHWFSFWPTIFLIAGLFKIIHSDCTGGRLWGGFLLALGVVLELNHLGYAHVRFENIWPVFVIAVGLLMIWHAFESKRETQGSLSPRLTLFSMFGGGEQHIRAKNFRGGDITAVFGGFEVDLTQADMESDQAMMDVNVMFGGGEIRVPDTWAVIMRGVGIFGGYGNKAREPQPTAAQPVKTLVVKGVAIFGGVEVKN